MNWDAVLKFRRITAPLLVSVGQVAGCYYPLLASNTDGEMFQDAADAGVASGSSSFSPPSLHADVHQAVLAML